MVASIEPQETEVHSHFGSYGVSQIMGLPLLGQGNRKLSTDRKLVGNIGVLLLCDVILLEIMVFILGGCHSHILPSVDLG